ncbi:ejaculatory bulb-specific protein 3 [Linepithema humile]|uniref:ejaculatory bulb-specific protein 3 n=1 Tax=Linepithema humile TaxID=83485 RepID=UPI00062389B9|nr:PREDICTED: ejaculatory bulb-specific protein 3-like [Linepithema humile]
MVRLSCIVIISIALACVLAQEELYSAQYDNIDIVHLFENAEARQCVYNCFMDVGPCDSQSQFGNLKFFKGIFPEALHDGCKKCTEKQKEYLKYITDWYTTNEPDAWNALLTKIQNDFVKKDVQ